MALHRHADRFRDAVMPLPALALAAMISGGASLLGGVQGNNASAREATKNRNFENEQAEREMAFQREMSSTEYQRAVADMKAAGLNPILAAKGGNSSPSGASGGGTNATQENILEEAGKTPMLALKAKADLALTDEMTKTEKSKQAVNYSNAGGRFGAPGFLSVPFSSAAHAKRAMQSKAAYASYKAAKSNPQIQFQRNARNTLTPQPMAA